MDPDGWIVDVRADASSTAAAREAEENEEAGAGRTGAGGPGRPGTARETPPGRTGEDVAAREALAHEAEVLAGIVLPGIPNVHSHAFQRAMAGRAEGGGGTGGFWSWRDVMYRFAGAFGPDEVEAVAAFLYAEMLEAGYTSVAEFHYLHLDPQGRPYADPAELSRRLLRAAETAGIGITLLPALYVTGGFGGAEPDPGQRRFLRTPEQLLRIVEALVPEAAGAPDRRLGLAFHSLRAVPPEAFAPTLSGLGSLLPGCPVHIHVAEQEREVEECLAWSGARPVEWLLSKQPVDARWTLVHATHVDGSEVRDMASRGCTVGLCPTTEADLGDGLFPVAAFRAAGGRLGIGSDSHVSVSPVEEMRWLEYGQRLVERRRGVVSDPDGRSVGRTLLEAVLDGGARSAGRPVGRLAAGGRADWVVLDPDHPDLGGRSGDGAVDGWVFGPGAGAVREVFVGGRRRVRRGVCVGRKRLLESYRSVVSSRERP